MGRTSDARDRLITSCGRLMHEKGYTAVGVSEVCSRAGVNKGSFYYFFPSKQELALAVIDSFGEGSHARLVELATGEGRPLERLRRFFQQSYEAQVETRQATGKMCGCPLGNLALEMSTQDPELTARLRRTFDRQIDGFEAVLSKAVEDGDLPRSLDTRRAATSVMALAEGATLLAKMHDDPEMLRGLADDALSMIGAEGVPQH